jgi:hypothetical protein
VERTGGRGFGCKSSERRLRLAFSSSDKQTWDHDHLGTPPTTDFSFEKTKGMGKNKRGYLTLVSSYVYKRPNARIRYQI